MSRVFVRPTVSNHWSRSAGTRPRVCRYGRPSVALTADERADFVELLKIGRRFQSIADRTPADWVRGSLVDRDTGQLVLALVRGWRWADDQYPVLGA